MDIKPPDQTGLFEALYSTRALRRFKPDPVSDEVLFQAIDAAIRAPAGGNQQIWHFLVIREADTRMQISKWYEDGWNNSNYRATESDAAAIAAMPRQQRMVVESAAYLAHNMHEAPVLVFICGPRGAGASIYPAIQNFLLACRGLGLGSALTSLYMRHADDIAKLLAIRKGSRPSRLCPSVTRATSSGPSAAGRSRSTPASTAGASNGPSPPCNRRRDGAIGGCDNA